MDKVGGLGGGWRWGGGEKDAGWDEKRVWK